LLASACLTLESVTERKHEGGFGVWSLHKRFPSFLRGGRVKLGNGKDTEYFLGVLIAASHAQLAARSHLDFDAANGLQCLPGEWAGQRAASSA
jgi:hypothetical protein